MMYANVEMYVRNYMHGQNKELVSDGKVEVIGWRGKVRACHEEE